MQERKMADALVVPSIKVLLEKALSLATDGIGLIFGFKKDLETLRASATMICAVLADADDQQRHNQAVQIWLKRLEGVAFEAENVLDELHYEKFRRQLKGKVCSFFLSSKANIVLRCRMASKVKNINMKLKIINDGASGFGLTRFQMATPLPNTLVNRQTDSVAGQIVVGRANDEIQIVETLLSLSERAVSVIPIIGMGGLGKTTLAQSIYNNQQIDRHFEKKIWVFVSENFEVTRLLKLILESLTRRNVEIASRDAIVQEIRGQLMGKRYLLVLDDVWTEAPILWDDFFHSLVGLNTTNGNWCLVTTRKQKTASIVATGHPYVLGKLFDDDCWSIFKEKVIADGEVPEELNVIREEIVKTCRGVPLVASVLGGLLRMKRKEEWHSILDERLLNLSGDEDSITQILKLSFDYLPSPSIKKCFAYCSVFDKDTKLDSNLLIELWMAEGFLQPDLTNEMIMEELGQKYFRILLQNSLVEEVRDESWGTYYKMHDLVHDLAESVSKFERIKLESGTVDNNIQVRYLVVNSSGETIDKILKDRSTSVRTLFLKNCISGGMLSNFKNLHVLNLSGARTKELPITIGKLIHLRHIDVSNSKIQLFPESLCKLYNLQTLRILECETLKYLPMGMSKLVSLRHLHYYNDDDASFQMPMQMGRLTCLQTLKFFNVGQEKGRQIDELGCLKDLKGRLVIRNLELVNGKEGSEKANVFGKANIFGLEFEWFSSNRGAHNCDEDVLEGLQPPPNLKELAIKRFVGDKFPEWFMNLSTSLHKLERLSLRNCKRCTGLPTLGQLPFLQHLVFHGLENVRCIGLSFYGIDDSIRSSREVPRKLFPALKTLSLERMGNLEEWMGAEADDVVVFPVLESLTIDICSKLATAPSHFPSLKNLYITKNDHVLVVQNILSRVTSTLSYLKIDYMAGLTCVSDAATATGGGLHNNLPNLKHLTLWECPNLISITGCGTSLERLELSGCDNLREFSEDASGFQSLRSLRVERCPRIQFLNVGLQNLTSLEDLTIDHCDGLTHLHNEILKFCTSLRRLQVHNCPNLVSFPLDLQQTPSLSEIELSGCPKLKTNMVPKGFGFLTSLWQLRIGPFSDDDENSSFNELDWSGLISSSTLRDLALHGLAHMESLPDQLQYLTSLSGLSLHEFGSIEALPDWIGNLGSLEILTLFDCEKLKYFPSADAMRRLTKLNLIQVSCCPLLKERCTPQGGADSEWSKISHISIRWIEWQTVKPSVSSPYHFRVKFSL